jgi:putative copper export protein
MAIESLASVPVLQGVLYGLIGVGIWVGGLLVFNWVWNHYRDGERAEPADGDNV